MSRRRWMVLTLLTVSEAVGLVLVSVWLAVYRTKPWVLTAGLGLVISAYVVRAHFRSEVARTEP